MFHTMYLDATTALNWNSDRFIHSKGSTDDWNSCQSGIPKHLNDWLIDHGIMPFRKRMFDQSNRLNFKLVWHSVLNLYSASSQKQEPKGRLVTLLRHIILTLSQPVITPSTKDSLLDRDAVTTNFKVIDGTRLVKEHRKTGVTTAETYS